MIETSARSTDDVLSTFDPSLLARAGSGSGDGGSSGDDQHGGGGWDWSDEPADDAGGGRRRHPPFVRAMALATVASVALGSVGTFALFLAAAPSVAAFGVSAIETSVQSTQDGPVVAVGFEVTNQSAKTAPALCRATLATDNSVVGAGTVRVPRLWGGQVVRATVQVPITATSLAGHGAASATVRCNPSS